MDLGFVQPQKSENEEEIYEEEGQHYSSSYGDTVENESEDINEDTMRNMNLDRVEQDSDDES